MVPDWLLGSTEAVGPLLLGATIVITAVAVLLLIRLLRRNGPQPKCGAKVWGRGVTTLAFCAGRLSRMRYKGLRPRIMSLSIATYCKINREVVKGVSLGPSTTRT